MQKETSNRGSKRKQGRETEAMKRKSRTSTAYHEAGHAVASYLLHHRFSKVTIAPNLGEGYLGQVDQSYLTKDPNGVYQSQRDRVERDVLIFLAGESAEARFLGHHNWKGASQDTRSALDLLEILAPEPTGEETSAYFRLMACRAKTLWLECIPGGQHRWSAVRVLAEALLVKDTLGYREARKIVAEVIDKPISKEEVARSQEAYTRWHSREVSAFLERAKAKRPAGEAQESR